MSRTKPKVGGCTGTTPGLRIVWKTWRPGVEVDAHDWVWSNSWNGNTKKLLPFEGRTSGIRRSGWRCSHCGKFVWEERDEIYALKHAYYNGMLPQFEELMTGYELPHGRKIHHQSVTSFKIGVARAKERAAKNGQ